MRFESEILENEKGFSLIELMIVIAIMGLLMALVGKNVMSKFAEAKVSTTKIQMRELGTVLDDFKRVCGFYPTTDQGLESLIHPPTGGRECKNYDPEGFLKEKRVPADGWGNPFDYSSDGNKYVLKSLGNDGKPGGEGNDKDISSDDLGQ